MVDKVIHRVVSLCCTANVQCSMSIGSIAGLFPFAALLGCFPLLYYQYSLVVLLGCFPLLHCWVVSLCYTTNIGIAGLFPFAILPIFIGQYTLVIVVFVVYL